MKAKYLLGAIVLGMAASLAAPDARAGEWTGNTNLLGGLKFMDDEWKPAEDQGAFGIALDIRKDSWPVNLITAYTFARSEEEGVALPSGGTVQVQSKTDQLDLGLRKYFDRFERWRPFVGGGVAFAGGELRTKGPGGQSKVDDTGFGFWGSLGSVYTIGDFINLGGELKYSKVDVELGGNTFDAGGIQFNILVGVHY